MKHFQNINDLIGNIKLPEDVITFLNNLNTDITLGRHELSNGNFANVMELNAKEDNGEERDFEIHKKYNDIQIVLVGEEIMCTCLYNPSTVTKPYDEQTDYEFFSSKPTSYEFLKPFEPLLIEKEVPHCGGYNSKVNHIKKVIIKFQ